MKKTIECKNNPINKIELTVVPDFPQLGVLCEGICAGCNIRPLLRQDIRVVSFEGEKMVACVPAMMGGGLEVQLAILKLIGASAEEIASAESKIQAEEQ